jgi:hypothetical protein
MWLSCLVRLLADNDDSGQQQRDGTNKNRVACGHD